MTPLVFSLFYSQARVEEFIRTTGYDIGEVNLHYFPDKESCIQLKTDVVGKDVILFDSFNDPNYKIMPILYFAETARMMGAKRVGLVAPYLAYMRQDNQFHPGEGVSAKFFAQLLSKYFNWMLTIDPHLHRIKNLNNIYTIPTSAIHAAHNIAEWIKQEVVHPLIVGPDTESEQWISDVATTLGAPFMVLKKKRFGDDNVKIDFSKFKESSNHSIVFLDDIISSAATMIDAVHNLYYIGLPATCIGIHGVFAAGAFEKLKNSSPTNIVTCNTIEHETNAIKIDNLLKKELDKIFG